MSLEVSVSPMVADSNGGDAASATLVPSVLSSEEADQQTNGHVTTTITVAAVYDDSDEEGLLNNVESSKDGDDGAMDSATPITRSPSTRKKRGAFGLFRSLLQSFGRSDSTKMTGSATSTLRKKAVAAAENDDKPPGNDTPTWKSLVDGVRPLRLRGQELEYYPPPPPLGSADVYHDVLLPPPSPARSGFEPEEVGMTSRYWSAQDLYQMDSGEEEEDAAPAAEGGCCPHAIDMQAEEFIAKFYEQFRSESFNGRAFGE